MSSLRLSFAFASNPRTRSLFSEEVRPEGIELIGSNIHMSELAWRQFGFKEFQVSELSISSLLMARSKGDDTWVGLPVFTSRQFFHTGILVRDEAQIKEPGDLAGKRVGVPEYQQTAALWGRGVLQHEFGVDLKSIQWFMERPPEKSHGGMLGFTPPEGINLQYIPRTTDIGEMLQQGELDATLLYIRGNNLVDRSTAEFGPGSGVSLLFPDKRGESTRYFSKTGIIPMNHTAVVRKDVVEEHPWVILNLYSAFLEARKRAVTQSLREIGDLVDVGKLESPAAKTWAADPFPYGIIANRDVLEAAFAYHHEQGLSTRKMELEDVYYRATFEL